jgi:hypothetical protein
MQDGNGCHVPALAASVDEKVMLRSVDTHLFHASPDCDATSMQICNSSVTAFGQKADGAPEGSGKCTQAVILLSCHTGSRHTRQELHDRRTLFL